jgi:hypothetical protein
LLLLDFKALHRGPSPCNHLVKLIHSISHLQHSRRTGNLVAENI